MKIKSAKAFRRYVWKKPEGGNEEKSVNYNFVGSFATVGKETKHGFFKMYHGIKPDIAAFLPSLLKIAEDGQAIYEFLQNAVDCNSTHFYIFYNEKYFLAINNGEPFDIKGLESVLNIAQTTKKSCDKIGRFGIGFKLVHRLVGKNEGVSELVNEYKGPILFSWARLKDLQGLMEKQFIEPLSPNKENYQEFINAPYLLKLILTNFPAEPNETIKDLHYKDRVVFSQEELNEMIDFLNDSFQQHAENIKMNVLKQGSIFFLRLGEGKKEMLDRDYEDLKKGIQYSMNTLKRLQKVYINSGDIGKQTLDLEEFEIHKNSKEFALINPEYKECNIKVSFGYYRNYKQSEKIKASPNFYKYFPMGDETNGFSFIIHCDSFSNEANRRKLQRDSVNTNLLPVITNFIISRLNEYKISNREQFLRLYACLLLSDVPTKENNKWLKPIFYDNLLDYLCANIPTKYNQFSEKPENVKINKLKISLDLADFGLNHIQWFEWESDNDFELVKETREKNKLALETWNFSDIMLNCDITKTNEFILSIYNSNKEQYVEIIGLINEITEFEWRKDDFKLYHKYSQLIFFPYKDVDNNYLVSLAYCVQNNIIVLQSKHQRLQTILEKLGLLFSSQDVDKNLSTIGSLICEKVPYIKDENKFYEIISKRCALQANNLGTDEKHLLFKHLQELQGIGPETIKKLSLFSNGVSQVKPLSELVDSAISTPIWINSLKIKEDENFAGLKEYLISEKKMYQEIILPNWEEIISKVTHIVEFYQRVKFYYDQDEKNIPLKKQAFTFINEDERFVTSSDIFYNNKFSQISNYQDFQNAVLSLTDTQTPQKQIFNYLKEAPFEVKNSNLLDFSIKNNTELSLDEVKTILAFCKSNNENFFQKCTIQKQDESFIIFQKSKNEHQVRPSKKEIRQFIEDNLSDTFKMLPYELDEYKDETGVIQGELLYSLILESVNTNDFKTELIDIIHYDEPKRKFLLQILEVRLISGKEYDKNSFEYKILNLACDSNILKEADYPKFREKIIIVTSEQDLTLEEIPPFADNIKIEGYELSLAQILPNTYQNSKYLGEFMKVFDPLHERLKVILNIKDQEDYLFYYDLLLKELPKVDNVDESHLITKTEQLVFLCLFAKISSNVNFNNFYLYTFEEEYVWQLEKDFYINHFSFIEPNAILKSDRYKNLEKYAEVLISVKFNNKLSFYNEPFLSSDKFSCPQIKKELTENEKLDFINFLYQKWQSLEFQGYIKKIDWSKIDNVETEKILGFNPKYSVYPNEFALKIEELPKYLQEWITEDSIKISFISDLGIFTENSTLVSLRKFFINKGDFNKSKIAQDSRLADEKMLFNTFEWLKSKELELNSKEEFEVLREMERVINSDRVKGQELKIKEDYDSELLESETTEWETPYYQSWKERLENKFSIYLFEGALPKYVWVYCSKLLSLHQKDKETDWCFLGHIFYRFNQDDIVINKKNNIFINRNADIKKVLSSLISGENDFSTEDLLLLYQIKETAQTGNGEVTELKSEVERLRQVIESLTRVSGRDNNDVTTKTDDYFTEIKEKSEEYLFNLLKNKYPSQIVKWLNYNENTKIFKESWQNHDFEILNKNGTILYYIDCKGTPQQKGTFYLTSNEWAFFLDCIQNGKSYQIYRVFNVENNTNFIHIDNLWEWIETGKVVPYLSATETIKGGRVFLTICN